MAETVRETAVRAVRQMMENASSHRVKVRYEPLLRLLQDVGFLYDHLCPTCLRLMANPDKFNPKVTCWYDTTKPQDIAGWVKDNYPPASIKCSGYIVPETGRPWELVVQNGYYRYIYSDQLVPNVEDTVEEPENIHPPHHVSESNLEPSIYLSGDLVTDVRLVAEHHRNEAKSIEHIQNMTETVNLLQAVMGGKGKVVSRRRQEKNVREMSGYGLSRNLPALLGRWGAIGLLQEMQVQFFEKSRFQAEDRELLLQWVGYIDGRSQRMLDFSGDGDHFGEHDIVSVLLFQVRRPRVVEDKPVFLPACGLEVKENIFGSMTATWNQYTRWEGLQPFLTYAVSPEEAEVWRQWRQWFTYVE